MKTRIATHPWISFHVDLREITHSTWMLLGEAESKCNHIAGIPLEPETAKVLFNVYLAKGALATTAIEGNTLTETDAQKIVEGTLVVPPSKEYLKREIENIIDACNRIAADRDDATGDLGVSLICEFNANVLDGIPIEAHVVPGKIRTIDVGVSRYKAPAHGECAELLQGMCDWLNSPALRQDGDHTIAYALIRAVLAHLYLAWIHPFGDGNGRTARLLEHYILINAGVPMPAAQLLSNHYNVTRSEYYRQLAKSSQTGGDVMQFMTYAIQGFVDGLKEQLDHIDRQQWTVAWTNYVHRQFHDRESPAEIRRKHVVLDLGEKTVTVPELRTLSPRVAAEYSKKQEKTLARDVNTLIEMNLIVRADGKIRAKREAILAFLPPRRQAPPRRDDEGA